MKVPKKGFLCPNCLLALDLYPNVSGHLGAYGCLQCQLYWTISRDEQLLEIKQVKEKRTVDCPTCGHPLKKYQQIGGAVGVYKCNECSGHWTPNPEWELAPFDPLKQAPAVAIYGYQQRNTVELGKQESELEED